jgi:dipeptidase E
MAPKLGTRFAGSTTPTSDDGLGVVNFAMFPHLDDEELPGKSIANAEEWAASVPVPAYAIDDQTAIKVTNDVVEVVSEGHWKLFAPRPEAS